jgi:hypothetical protein
MPKKKLTEPETKPKRTKIYQYECERCFSQLSGLGICNNPKCDRHVNTLGYFTMTEGIFHRMAESKTVASTKVQVIQNIGRSAHISWGQTFLGESVEETRAFWVRLKEAMEIAELWNKQGYEGKISPPENNLRKK